MAEVVGNRPGMSDKSSMIARRISMPSFVASNWSLFVFQLAFSHAEQLLDGIQVTLTTASISAH
jgi:hypothetical protein